MKKLGFNVVAFTLLLMVCSFVPKEDKPKLEEDLVKWYTWEEATELMKVEKKKIFPKIYIVLILLIASIMMKWIKI